MVPVRTDPSQRALDGALGFAAGVMLSASFTSPILPGIEHPHGGVYPVIAGILPGVVVPDRADRWVPHVHFLVTGKRRIDSRTSEGAESRIDDERVVSVLLFVVAITLHNMPERLAVGVGFGAVAVTPANPLLPCAMGFAADGMLFVISDEIVPETHARGNERVATLGTMVGVVVMLYLDVVLA